MKYLLVIFLCLFTGTAFCQKIIDMELSDGVYKVPCKVNGVKMKFVFDTGASAVCLSKEMAMFLFENDYLKEEDFVGKGTSLIADGSKVNHTIANIRDLEIDGLHISNVKAIIVESQSAPLLLGQSAIQKLGRISIEGNRLIIYSASSTNKLSSTQLKKVFDDAWEYYDSKSYAAAIENFLILRENGQNVQLPLANSYWHNHQYREAINAYKEYFVSDMSRNENSDVLADAYLGCANCYENLEDYRNALIYVQKAEHLFPEYDFYKYCIAYDYKMLGEYDKSNDYHKEAIDLRLKELEISIKDITAGNVEDYYLGMYLYSYATNLLYQNRIDDAVDVVKLSAQCRDELGIKYCIEHEIDFSSSKKLFK